MTAIEVHVFVQRSGRFAARARGRDARGHDQTVTLREFREPGAAAKAAVQTFLAYMDAWNAGLA